jgi:4-azaleucine resistance transporter AzlC
MSVEMRTIGPDWEDPPDSLSPDTQQLAHRRDSVRTTARAQFLYGVRAELPILFGVAPFGMIFGVLAREAGLDVLQTQAMSSVVFAGSAQFVMAQLFASHTPFLVIVLTAFLINLRHALYSASVAPYLRHLPRRWRWFLAYLLTDEAYAVTIMHYRLGGETGNKHWFFLGSGLALWGTWQASTAAGIFLGAQVPAAGRWTSPWP